jgi:hypothetical protein
VKRVALFTLALVVTACSPASRGAPAAAPAPDSTGSSTSSTVTTTPAGARVTVCATPVVAVAAAKVPHDVETWSGGAPAVGSGALWTIRSAFGTRGAVYPGHGWLVKFPWFTRPFGLPRIDGKRIDGAGTFRAGVDRAVDESGTFVTSSLVFSTPGCWEITSRFDDSVVRFRLEVGPAP